mmetsp:Transcript_26579/g.37692  ORF Transcript_26579/g.37692 Transcript_26579/m.37692 type:complete len:157 (+) Transcript_26579:103-573(+)
MPNNVIDRVHALACRQKANPRLVFLNRYKQPILEDGLQDDISAVDDSTYHPNDDTSVTDASSTHSSDSSYHIKDDSSIASETSSSSTDDDRNDTGYEAPPQQIDPADNNDQHTPPNLPPPEDQTADTEPPATQPHAEEPNNTLNPGTTACHACSST